MPIKAFAKIATPRLKIKAIKVLLQECFPKVDALGKAAPASLILVLMDNLLIL